MAEEYKNTVAEHETPKVATEEPSTTTTGEVKDRGLFDFLGKKKDEEVKPQETTTLASEFDHKAQISEPTSVDEEALEHKHTLLEELHEKTDVDEENKPSVIEKLHRSNSSSSSSSDEEDEEKKKKRKEKKKIVEGEEEKKGVMEKIKEKLPGHEKKPEDHHDVPVLTNIPTPDSTEHHEPEKEKKGVMDQIKEKHPGHSKKPEDSPLVTSEHPVEHSTEHTVETPAEKKGIIEKIKEKLPGYHAKTSAEEEKKEKESH